MKLLPKHLRREYNYYSDSSVDELHSDLQQLFDPARNFSVNLTGKFTSALEFRITPRWQLVFIRNFERELSFLYGRIYQDDLKRTRVTFTVRANSIFTIFFFFFPLLGLAAWNCDNLANTNSELLSVELWFTLAVPTLMFAIASFAKRAIRKRFIRTFDLNPVET